MAEQKEMETMEQPEAGQAEETQEAPPCPEGDTGEGNQAQPEGAEESPETEEAGEVPEEGGEEPAGEGQGEQKKSFFKKKDKKNKQEEKIAELTDRVQRQMAEFDNFRKRTDKEKSAMYEIGARDMIEKILPVLDNFERGLAAVPEDLKDSSFAEGVAMIYKQFVKTLEDAGVEAIEAVGQPFDPNLHNAVMHIDDDAYGENEISQELQKGYRYRGTVVRHSMVQVAN